MLQMIVNLLASRTVAIVQFPPDVFARLGDECQYGLIALLPFVLRVVALASAHLIPIERVYGRVGVQSHRRQPDVGRLPHPLPHRSLDRQNLQRHVQVQRRQKPP